MAKIQIDGKDVMRHFTINLDKKELERECLGVFKWRLRLGMMFLFFAAKIMRTNVDTEIQNDE